MSNFLLIAGCSFLYVRFLLAGTRCKLTIKATGRIFVGARSKLAFELQNDRKKYFLLTKMYFYLVTFKSIYMMYIENSRSSIEHGGTKTFFHQFLPF